MSAETATGNDSSKDTLLLYCPYDRKVTRHARRGADNTIVCVECGRRLEVSHTQRSAPIVPISPAAAPYGGVRPSRVRRLAERRRRAAPHWLPFLLVSVVTAGALWFLATSFDLVANPFSRSAPAATETAGAVAEPSAPAPQRALEPAPRAAAPETAAAPEPPGAQQVRVANTGGTGVYLRRTPNMDDRLRAWADGTPLRVIGPDTTQDGTTWKHVQDPAGNEGWVPAQYTASAS